MKKPNLKSYQGKKRIYIKATGCIGVHRLFVWNEDKGEYQVPKRGKVYFAIRYEVDSYGVRKRKSCYFETLAEARDWQNRITDYSPKNAPMPAPEDSGVKFAEVIDEWRKRKFPCYASGTRDQYDKLIRLSFGKLMEMPIRTITPRTIDTWIFELKKNHGRYWQAKTRKSFEKELTCLGVVLRYYENYHDDLEFRFPIKRRHREDIKLRVEFKSKEKDLPLEDFLIFREALKLGSYGEQMVALATVQYFQALRISEAAALHWQDVTLDFKEKENSRVVIRRHVVWKRTRHGESFIAAGFKNSHAIGGEKDMPMFPETFKALKSVYRVGDKGLVFVGRDQKFFTFRQIAHAYNKAFKSAGLSYSGTHVMRHGGCRNVFNETKDMGVAAQILGNVSMGTVEVYAKRYKSALTDLAKKHWQDAN